MRRLATVLVLVAAPVFGAAPDIEVTAAWNGHYLPSAATEISVRLATARGSDVDVSATTPAATVSTHVTTTAGEPVVVHLPLGAPGHGVVDIQVTTAGGKTVHSRLRLRPADRPLRVLATAGVELAASDPAHIVADAASLPVFAQGYDAVGALIVDGATLARLSTRQLAALQAHVAGCGRIGLVDVPPSAQSQLRSLSGCGGRALAALEQSAAIADFFADDASIEPMPAASGLSALLSRHTGADSAGVLFGLAGLSVLAVAMLARGGVPLAGLIAVPLIGAALLAGAATTLQPRSVDTLYADMVSGDATARFVRLIRVDGGGPGRTTVSVEPGWIRPGHARDLRIEATGTAFDEPHLHSQTAFLGRRDIALYGARRLEHPLRLTMDGILPSVANIGESPVDGVLLAWRDDELALPTIGPGQTWSPDADSIAAAEGPLRHLLRARSGNRQPALLAPLDADPDGADGWVLIRTASGVTP